MPFFNQQDFDLFAQYAGKYSHEAPDGHEKLRKVYNKLGVICDNLSTKGYKTHIRRNPLNQGLKYEVYHWCQIYPSNLYKSCNSIIFFVVGIDKKDFNVHIDSNARKDYFCNKAAQQIKDNTWLSIPAKDMITKSKEEILYIIDNYIKTHYIDFLKYGKEFKNQQCIQILKDMEIQKIATMLKSKKNLILQGAPGTGKTYNTASLALSVIGENIENYATHEALMRRYDELVKAGQIGFCTFHQSMDYEDFVEGLKPMVDNGQVTYKIENGIFKQLCLRAKSNTNFNEAYNELLEFLSKDDKMFQLKTTTGKTFGVRQNTKGNLTLFTGEDLQQNGTLTRAQLENWFMGENDYQYWSGYYKGVIGFLQKKFNLSADNQNKNYVLIIDEINRGNVSKIFGELITLLEADKRLGGGHPIILTLPYSKESFNIPSNLYIIGTMNTTDRSVGTIDYAVRRRFAFVTLPSQIEVIQEYDRFKSEDDKQNAIDLFDAVKHFVDKNKVDGDIDDLMVGHSYFLASDEDALDSKWTYEIYPLLIEYYKDGIIKEQPKKSRKDFVGQWEQK